MVPARGRRCVSEACCERFSSLARSEEERARRSMGTREKEGSSGAIVFFPRRGFAFSRPPPPPPPPPFASNLAHPLSPNLAPKKTISLRRQRRQAHRGRRGRVLRALGPPAPDAGQGLDARRRRPPRLPRPEELREGHGAHRDRAAVRDGRPERGGVRRGRGEGRPGPPGARGGRGGGGVGGGREGRQRRRRRAALSLRERRSLPFSAAVRVRAGLFLRGSGLSFAAAG